MDRDVLSPAEERELNATWGPGRGLLGWLSQVNHKAIGKRYIVTAFVFFLLGGIQALMMRVQLAQPESNIIGPDFYNQLFTMHGTTMMFLFAVPMMEGLAIYLVPLMIGTRDMVFPRLNAFGYYVYLIGGSLLYLAFFLGMAPDAGWFNYPTLAGIEFSPGLRIDFWVTLITFIEVAALVAAVELVVTILKQRAPGMALHRMPLFVWSILVMALMIIFAMPAVVVSSLLLALDRMIGTQFYVPGGGGDVLLWQHLFWFFGHPEVYIIFVPALGIISAILITFCRRRIFGYIPLVLALVATGFISFGLWVHHMYAAGLPPMGESFFTAASMIIGIPTGVQVFCWIATIWGSRPKLQTPMLYVAGFMFLLVAGGLTGIMVASVPFDLQVHDSFFVVAHFHYVLIGGAVFPLLGGIYYWFPKLTGRMMNETLGKISFWILFIGFNVTFFPMHQLGFVGMPRRIYTYLEPFGWGDLNLLATVGAFVMALATLIFLIDIAWALKRGPQATGNPWNADSLEWSVSSPPPSYNFARLPIVDDRYPLWSGRPQEHVSGLRSDTREIMISDALDARGDHKLTIAGPSIWPLLAALAASVAFVGSIFTTWAVPAGFLLLFVAMVGWFWPREGTFAPERRRAPDRPVSETRDLSTLPTAAFGSRSPFWWGAIGLVAIEATVFATLLVSYFYLALGQERWPPAEVASRDPFWATVNTVLLIGSLFLVRRASRNVIDRARSPLLWLLGCAVIGLTVAAIRFYELATADFRWSDHAYGSIYWAIYGVNIMHVTTGMLAAATLAMLSFGRSLLPNQKMAIQAFSIYWQFIVYGWLPFYAALYLMPRFG
jgi:cytochrome c oxidase subunit I+III